MFGRNVLILAPLALLVAPFALAFQTGAPRSACAPRRPQHPMATEAPSASSPFKIVAPPSAKPGQTIDVTISGAAFRGYLLQAVASQDPSAPPLGQFVHQGQTLACQNPKDTATHTNPDRADLPSETVQFAVPPGVAQIYFRATIVPDLKTYYRDVFSAPVAVA